MASPLLRIGFVPEHFSTPLHFAVRHFGLKASLVPFPSGTGHMITSLRSKEIDVGIGLTEGWIAGLGRKKDASTGEIKSEKGYSLVGTYVETPLCWAISTGIGREELKSVADLKGAKLGVSRMGSGSHIMGFVLADQQNWLSANTPPFSIHPLQAFASLREAVNDSVADFFMWEYFTSKRYYTPSPTVSHPIKQIGEIYTPWPSWHIVASDAGDPRLADFFQKLDQGVEYFEGHQDAAVAYIAAELDYSEEDARTWLGTVRFAHGVKGVRGSVVGNTVGILEKAGLLVGEDDGGLGMIGIENGG